ncbi:MAG: 2-amino-4-hydroxy-6-hydroxymethyldihydropteridine diphosphokinase [Acidiferrobacterales bacterium]|nr:2-amino-4-hydroxy-6-hydroxymethyldihydropteridine diphosphokinase [Acidiferrobacterales bacterium]
MQLTKAYLCLGSNIEPKKNLSTAVKRIQENFNSPIVSSVYQTPAEGFNGDDFLNLAIEIETSLSLAELLNYTNNLEQAAGRVRTKRGNFDNRTLDVDVVIYGDLVGSFEGKVLPAEDLNDYGHVLKPLVEIASKQIDPASGHSFQQLWDDFIDKQEFEGVVQTFEYQWLFLND